ncbi:MAG: YigZ family protein [Bacteroidales bacterium]|nr:YigZ family protein [Bacteroidales bacterium]MDZ4205144.1 YigZ family protein [Bacteroidales bacterium]
MLLNDTFKTIAKKNEALYKDKGSRFIALAFSVKDEEEAKKLLEDIKKQYYDACHHCYAWAIGPTRESQRMNDDGEPKGTAGKPIFGQILSFNLTNVLIVVVRYFGGIKLGVSGLIKAYKTASRLALENANIQSVTIHDYYKVEFEYLYMNDVMRLLKEESIIPEEFLHTNCCQVVIAIRKNNTDLVIQRLKLIKTIDIRYLRSLYN